MVEIQSSTRASCSTWRNASATLPLSTPPTYLAGGTAGAAGGVTGGTGGIGNLVFDLTGLFAVFPVMGSVLAVFSHRNYGQRFTVKLLRGMVQGFYAFTVFCVILALTLGSQAIAVCFALALLAAIAVQAVLMYWQAKKLKTAIAAD